MQRLLTSVALMGLGLVVANASQTNSGKDVASKNQKGNTPAASSQNTPSVMPFAADDNVPAPGPPVTPPVKDAGKVSQNHLVTLAPGASLTPDVEKKSVTIQDQPKTVVTVPPPAVEAIGPPAGPSFTPEVGKAPVTTQGDPKAVVTITPPVVQAVAPSTPQVGKEPISPEAGTQGVDPKGIDSHDFQKFWSPRWHCYLYYSPGSHEYYHYCEYEKCFYRIAA